MKRSIIKSLVFVVLVLAFALCFVVGPSEAQRVKRVVLKGTYAVVGSDVCVSHWIKNPFGGTLDTYWTTTTTLQGTAIFHITGHGTAVVSQVSMTHPIYTPIAPPPAPAASYWTLPISPTLPFGDTSTSEVTSTFDYTIDPTSRLIRRDITGGSGHFITGPHAGKYFKFYPYTTTGYVSLDLGTILGSTFDDNQDYTRILKIYNDDTFSEPTYAEQEQTCQRTRISVMIK
jgi:hypothetical protein